MESDGGVRREKMVKRKSEERLVKKEMVKSACSQMSVDYPERTHC